MTGELYNRYAPTDWPDYVGQDKAVKMIRRIIEAPTFDRGAFFIQASGANNSGVGKTTLARLIAGKLADPFFVTEANGDAVDKRFVQDWERGAWLTTWGDKPYRVLIVNEAHAITQGAIDALLGFLERLPKHCVVIFTTTRKPDEGLFGDDAGPFASRCFQVTLTNQGLAQAFAERARSIAQAEGMDGKPIGEYLKLVQKRKNNLRAVLQDIQAGAMLD